MDDLAAYRANVGIVLFNPQGEIWLGRRAHTNGPYVWQFPQGGVDEGEDLFAAAMRELEEETGVTSIELLGRIDGWVTYDFPPDYAGSKAARGWKGQKQAWFAFRFTGDDSEIRLDAHHMPEFEAWRWAPLVQAPALVVPFKRKAYDQVVRAFKKHGAAGPR